MSDPRDNTQAESGVRDRQVTAILASATIVIGFVVYWAIQVQSVREMLELAYG